MASRISQMRNGTNQSQQMPLNQSIEQVKGLMAQLRGTQDKEAILAQYLEHNPNTAFIANALQSGTGLEALARNMAQQRGIDINQLISQLSN